MNKYQRKELNTAITIMEAAAAQLVEAKEIVQRIQEEETEKFENLNEGMQAMESNQKLEAASDNLSDIYSEIEYIEGYIEEQVNSINEVMEA